MIDVSVFARHLDLTALNGRTAGKVRCIFHQERTASLSVDLRAGVFHCFGCGAEGGVKDFAERVGERPAAVIHAPEGEPTAWEVALDLARRQPWSREAVGLDYDIADWIRRTRQAVRDVRRLATEDTPETWALLERAARLETVTRWAEADLEAWP